MACVNCGMQTETEVYICEKCENEESSQFRIGASICIFPSTLNNMMLSSSDMLGLDTVRSTDSLNLIVDISQDKRLIEEASFSLENMTESGVKNQQKEFARMLINMGLSLDLEEKVNPILPENDYSLVEKILKANEELENNYPGMPDIELYLLIGSLHYTISSVNSGIITVAQKEYHLNKAVEYFDKVLSTDKNSTSGWKNKAKVLLERGEYEEAIQCLNWFLDNFELTRDNLSVLINKGIAFYNLGDLDKARECYDKVIDKDPANVEAWRRRGDVFAKMDRWGGAIQCYNEALKHDPTREDILISMAETYINHGKYQEASKCLDSVLKINIWNTEAWYLQGIVFSKIGRWGAAIQCLDKALNANSSHIKALKAKGDLLVGTNRFEDAMDCYEKALKILPKDPEILISKGRLLKLMKRYDDAQKIIEEILSINEDDPLALFEKGDILQETGKAYKALKCFDDALKTDPSMVEAYYKKGLTLEKLRRYKEAIQCYDMALELDPKFEKAQLAKKDCQLRMDGKSG